MSKITIKAKEIEIETDDLESLAKELRSILSTIEQPQPDLEWEEVWDDSNYDLHQDYFLHLYANYCEDQGIGFIKAWIGPKGDSSEDFQNACEESVFGTKQEIIRHAIKLWDECNTEQYVADFLAKHKPTTKPDTPE